MRRGGGGRSSGRRRAWSVMPLARTVQSSGAVTVNVEDGLEVGLVEGGEDALDVVHEQLGVDVGLAVGGVGEAVHALAGAGVAHARRRRAVRGRRR